MLVGYPFVNANMVVCPWLLVMGGGLEKAKPEEVRHASQNAVLRVMAKNVR